MERDSVACDTNAAVRSASLALSHGEAAAAEATDTRTAGGRYGDNSSASSSWPPPSRPRSTLPQRFCHPATDNYGYPHAPRDKLQTLSRRGRSEPGPTSGCSPLGCRLHRNDFTLSYGSVFLGACVRTRRPGAAIDAPTPRLPTPRHTLDSLPALAPRPAASRDEGAQAPLGRLGRGWTVVARRGRGWRRSLGSLSTCRTSFDSIEKHGPVPLCVSESPRGRGLARPCLHGNSTESPTAP